MAGHEHEWVELRRQIPWTVEDFDPDRLAPERSRYEDGTPHTDADHAAKVARPRPEIVFKCYGCDTIEAVPIPKDAYLRIVANLEAGLIRTDDPVMGDMRSSLDLDQLVPELAGQLEKRGLTGRTGTQKLAAFPDGLVVSDAQGEYAMETDARLRKQLGLPPRDAADDAVRASAKRYETEGRKASEHPGEAGEGVTELPERSGEVDKMFGKDES